MKQMFQSFKVTGSRSHGEHTLQVHRLCLVYGERYKDD